MPLPAEIIAGDSAFEAWPARPRCYRLDTATPAHRFARFVWSSRDGSSVFTLSGRDHDDEDLVCAVYDHVDAREPDALAADPIAILPDLAGCRFDSVAVFAPRVMRREPAGYEVFAIWRCELSADPSGYVVTTRSKTIDADAILAMRYRDMEAIDPIRACEPLAWVGVGGSAKKTKLALKLASRAQLRDVVRRLGYEDLRVVIRNFEDRTVELVSERGVVRADDAPVADRVMFIARFLHGAAAAPSSVVVLWRPDTTKGRGPPATPSNQHVHWIGGQWATDQHIYARDQLPRSYAGQDDYPYIPFFTRLDDAARYLTASRDHTACQLDLDEFRRCFPEVSLTRT